MKAFLSGVAGITILISFLGVIAKGLGLIRDIMLASIFGLSINFDIYLLGAVVPLSINIVILTLGQNYLIPNINRLKSESVESSVRFCRMNFVLFIVIGIILAVVLFCSSNYILIDYFGITDSTLQETIRKIFNLFLFTIPISCGISVVSAYQQSNFEFRYSVLSQLFPNLMIILLLYIFTDFKIYALPLGYLIGTILQIVYLLIKSPEIIILDFNYFYSVKKIKGLLPINLLIIVFIEIVGQLYIVVDRFFFNKIEVGGISALNYAQIIFVLPLNIFSIALSTVIFPKFSEYLNSNQFKKLEKIFNDSIIASIDFFTPIMIITLIYNNSIIKLFFERGNFSSIDSTTTGDTLFIFSFGLIFYAVYSILNKFIYSAGMVKQLLIITVLPYQRYR